jgi:HEAT repeat protein
MIKYLAFLTLVAGCLLAPSLPAADGNPERTQKLIAVLQSDAGLFEKARACQQLGEIGTKEAVPALAALLSDAKLNAYARSGLEGIPDPSAAAALRAALGNLKGNLLAGAVNSLGVLRDAEAVSALRNLAANSDSGVAKEALLALARISTAECIQTVRQALEAGAEALRPDAAAACLIAAEKQLADGQAEKAVALYDAVRNANVPLSYRVGATRGAILARKSEAPAFLVEQLRSNDRAIRHVALLTIREIPSDKLAGALNAELTAAKPELQVQLITALIDCHNAQSPSAVAAKFNSDAPEIRQAALTALGRIGGPAEAGLLLKVLADKQRPDEASLALASLERMEGAEIDGLILKELASATDADVRIKLIRLAGDRGAASATGELLKQAADADAKVSLAALRAAKPLVGLDDLPGLIALVKSTKDESGREAAESALCSACGKAGSGSPGGTMVLAELDHASLPAQKNSWLRVLTTLGYAKALPALKTFLSDADETVALNAIDCLGRWPDAGPIEELLAVVQTGSNAARRQRALGSVIRLATVAAEEGQRPCPSVAGWFQTANKAVQTVGEKRLIISGLGRLGCVEALAVVQPYLEDPAVQPEAATAVIQTTKKLTSPEDKLAAKPLLEKIVANVKSPTLVNQAQSLLRQIPAQGAVTLFDGRSLAGWEGETNVWRVREGVIVGGSTNGNPRNEFLASARRWTNFVLRLEYKLVGTEGFINSGVQFRSVRVKQPANEMSGYQADIGAGYSGCLYDESRRNKFLVQPPADQIKRLEKAGDWNRYEVRGEGRHIQIFLNGEKTVDFTESDQALPQEGLIGLQIHGGSKAEVCFRNLSLTELP